MELGEKVRQAREAKGWSQKQLGDRVGISQVAVKKIEAGDTKQSKFLPQIASALGLPMDELMPGADVNQKGTSVIPETKILGRMVDFPVYPATEGGAGEIIRMPEPMEWRLRPPPVEHEQSAYGLYVVGNSMVPEYRPGDVAIVNPRLPVIADEVYIFYAERNGEARCTIKHLRRATATEWHVSQHNPPPGKPKDFVLAKSEWQWAHRVIGKYTRT